MDEKHLASSACALSEAPDAYRGYFAPAEVAARLAALAQALKAAGRAELADRLAAICRDLPPAAPAPAVTDIAEAFDTLLPRIADDRLHASVTAARAAL